MRRCLIVANRTLAGPDLVNEVLARSAREPYEFHVVVPASRDNGGIGWTEGKALAHARRALDDALNRFRDAGVAVSGEVGDESPMLAVGDVVRREPVDEIIVSTLPPGVSRWLKRDLPHRLEREYGLPVTHVMAVAEPVA